jgi:THO complex subunit 1
LDEFKAKLDFVINKFYAIEQERLKLRGQAVNNQNAMDIVIGSEEKSEYYPGFLKSRQLFDLQLADSKFRRTVLFQIMVVMRHLLSLRESEKEKRDKRTKTPNKVVFYNFTLSPEDATWAQQKDKDAHNLTDLAFQPHPQHRTFTKAIRTVLDRDEAWVRWKENGCPPFEEPSWGEKEYDAMENRLRQILAPIPPYRYPLGNAALSDLWKSAGDMTMESLKGRVQLPAPEDFVTDELDMVSLEDLTEAEKVEKLDERASREWRGLRLAMRYDMAGVAENKGSLKKYVESKNGSTAEEGKKEEDKDIKDEQMADVGANGANGKLEDIKEEAMDIQNGH